MKQTDLPTKAADSGSSMFASFAIRPFRVIWVGTFFYYLSLFMGIIARGALAKDLGGTNTALGVVTLAFGAASLVATPIGGVVADRFPKRLVMIGSTLLIAATSLWLAITEVLDVTEFWMLVVVSAIQAVAFALLVPARMAYTIELVGSSLIPNAVALAQVSMNFNRVLGPALAGAMLSVAWLNYQAVYFASTALGVGSVICFAFLGPGLPNPNRPKRAPLAEMGDGVAYARANPTIRVVLVFAIMTTMVAFPYIAFLPSVSEDFFDAGASGYARLSLVGAVGGLVAGLAVARSSLASGRTIQFVSAFGIGLSLIFLGWAPTFVLSALAATCVGAATAGFQSMNGTMALSVSEPAFHGRIQSLLNLGFSAFGLASLPLGILADSIGLRPTLGLMGVATIVISVAVQIYWSKIDALPVEALPDQHLPANLPGKK